MFGDWYWALFGNLPALLTAVLVGGFLGVPIGLVADDLGFGEGVLVGLCLGTAAYGSAMAACLVLGVAAIPVDVARWVLRRLRRSGA